MSCFLCERPAVERCYTCGELFCELHGSVNCQRCETGFAPGDGRDDRYTSRPPIKKTKNARDGWWRPRPAEDFDPPACHECQGLARYICLECGRHYCLEHAGKRGLCATCHRAARSGNLFLAALFAGIVALLVLSWLQMHLQ